MYFNDIIKIKNFDFGNMLLDENSYGNILVHDILYKTLIGAKPLCIMFGENKYYLQVYLNNYAYKTVSTQRVDYLEDNISESD